MCPVPVLWAIRKPEYAGLLGLFFLQGVAMGIWFVPLSSVLDAHGYGSIKPYAYAASAIAAFVSPLFFGAMADRHASPARVLRGLACGAAVTMASVAFSIGQHWASGAVLMLVQLFALFAAPTWSIASAVAFSRLVDARSQFGPVRALATVGWMSGCWLVSVLKADATVLSVYTGSLVWLALAAYTLLLRDSGVPRPIPSLSWHERLGLDALKLLRHRDHRVVFLTVALYSIPLAAFYPYAPPHLREMGLVRTSAWMSLGQATEILAMFTLGALLLRWRLKWIFCLGLVFGVLRFVFSAMDTRFWLTLGIALHGLSFTFVFITAQIYLDERVDPTWRARAQALMSLVNGGFGNLLGFLGTGWWFAHCTQNQTTQWRLFWGALAMFVFGIMTLFSGAYRGIPKPVGHARAAERDNSTQSSGH